ncbi:Rne/Rng family ribonuclease [Bacillus shivajii]|uniref:Rne/Rng family ribonuclease n=1 Tax=Bacillus shivajii TaxID=1983719 RepID=UPI001CF965DA|nr:Rne/Rng family ribonuclease [Bacillus shivajii]UCZ52082.1 Rne/Rng family ribonuclease [Bacillus shivajii]
MLRKVILNTLFEEKRGAVLEGDRVVEWLYKDDEGDAHTGNIIQGKVVDIVPGMDAAFVDLGDEKNGYLYKNELIEHQVAVQNEQPPPSITSMLTKGQTIIVQVKKEATGSKGARLTEQFSIPGKYSVYLPNGDYVAVSKKMKSDTIREEWRTRGKEWTKMNEGTIIRTNAEHTDEKTVYEELERLRKQYEFIKEKAKKEKVPALLYDNDSLIFRVMRDFSADGETEIIVDCIEDFNWLKEWIDESDRGRIHFYQGKESIFTHYGLDKQLLKTLRPHVWLRNGASLVIESTEALTVIDVNTGKYVGKENFRNTVLKTNIEAAKAVAEQLRLRDIGGIIIIDFIEMKEQEDKEEVLRTLKSALTNDRTITKVAGFTKIGLVEMTRKKTRKPLADHLLETSQSMFGQGKEWRSNAIIEELRRQMYERRYTDEDAILVELTMKAANELLKNGAEKLKNIEQICNKQIYVLSKTEVEGERTGFSIRLTGDKEMVKQSWEHRK